MKIFIKHIVIILMIFTIWLLFQIFSIPCPSKLFFKVPCPACGTTRALFSLLKLDFNSYLNYNFMALPIVICIILEFHKKLFKNKAVKFISVVTFSTFVTTILCYFLKILTFF